VFSLTSRDPQGYAVVMTDEIMVGLNYKPNILWVGASEKYMVKICLKMISVHPDSGQN